MEGEISTLLEQMFDDYLAAQYTPDELLLMTARDRFTVELVFLGDVLMGLPHLPDKDAEFIDGMVNAIDARTVVLRQQATDNGWLYQLASEKD